MADGFGPSKLRKKVKKISSNLYQNLISFTAYHFTARKLSWKFKSIFFTLIWKNSFCRTFKEAVKYDPRNKCPSPNSTSLQ